MHTRLIAVGDKQPSWVDSAFADYAGRLPRQWKFRLDCLSAGQRGKNSSARAVIAAEGRDVLDNVRPSDFVVLLDERGSELSSRDLSEKLSSWQSAGRDLCFLIGGPDGVSADCQSRANFRWSLSRMTLPHGLARVMFAEQLYRAYTLTQGHPYHRD